ncbi:MAG: acyP [Bacteroidota bacterium]|nr:acyP [Bacteroidota bacterium]
MVATDHKHYNITVTGKVHGVFFRASAKQMADLLGLTGFVRNEPTSDVYIEVEGDEAMLVKFMQWCHHGPARAEVKYVSVHEGELKDYTRFEVRK